MPGYMIWYQYTDADGQHLNTLFAENYDKARDVITYIVCGLGGRAQLYQWDSENEYWIFLEE